jgi:hypothetical protein
MSNLKLPVGIIKNDCTSLAYNVYSIDNIHFYYILNNKNVYLNDSICKDLRNLNNFYLCLNPYEIYI